MQEVGRFSLYNNGGFVACIKFVYMGDDGMEHEVRASEGYPVLQTREASPGDCGVPDGSLVWLKVGVAAGHDNKSQRCFIYRAGNQQVADFAISGTTLDNSLQFKGLRTPAPQEVQPMFWGKALTSIVKSPTARNALIGAATGTATGAASGAVEGAFYGGASAEKGTANGAKEGAYYGRLSPLKSAAISAAKGAAKGAVTGAVGGAVGGVVGGVMGGVMGGTATGGMKLSSAYDDAVPDEEFSKLVPQGLVAEFAGQLITTLAPIAGDLVRVLLPLSANDDDAHLSAQGLLDQLVNTIMPTVLPCIGKMAVLLTQSIQEEQAEGIEPPAKASAQPYVLPEAWRASATPAN